MRDADIADARARHRLSALRISRLCTPYQHLTRPRHRAYYSLNAVRFTLPACLNLLMLLNEILRDIIPALRKESQGHSPRGLKLTTKNAKVTKI